MSISKEKVIERLEALNRDLQLLQERYHNIRGAIADCEYWLSQLEVKVEDNG